MLIRQSMNLAVHLAAGVAVGMLAVIALERSLRRDREDRVEMPPPPEPAPVPPTSGAAPGM